MDQQKINELKKELKALLDKYNVFISFNVDNGSDTYGLTGEEIQIRENKGEAVIINDGWTLSAHNIN